MAWPGEPHDLSAILPRQPVVPLQDPSTLADMFPQQAGSPRFHVAGQKTTSELIFPRARPGHAAGARAGRGRGGAGVLRPLLPAELSSAGGVR